MSKLSRSLKNLRTEHRRLDLRSLVTFKEWFGDVVQREEVEEKLQDERRQRCYCRKLFPRLALNKNKNLKTLWKKDANQGNTS